MSTDNEIEFYMTPPYPGTQNIAGLEQETKPEPISGSLMLTDLSLDQFRKEITEVLCTILDSRGSEEKIDNGMGEEEDDLFFLQTIPGLVSPP